jgi:hypothetical protein
MKAQHQFIQNLQRANLSLKQKVKQTEEVLHHSKVSEPMFSNRGSPLRNEDYKKVQPLEDMGLVSTGPIQRNF